MVKRALVTGITGQDGAYLTEFLLKKGYEVHGLQRRSSMPNTARILPWLEHIRLHDGDVTDTSNIVRLLSEIRPHEIYNLAAQSHVAVSFETPEYTAQVDGIGVLRILEAMRILGLNETKFYQAATSELFGKVQETPQRETTPFQPRSPYAIAKLYAYWMVVNYRDAYDLFACNGILFNHESPLRGETFVTRKITRAVARIACGSQEILFLGNLDAVRDWGYAPDYVEAMWLMLQQEYPEDFIIATGTMHSVREFVICAFEHVGITLDWQRSGTEEIGVDTVTGIIRVAIDKRLFRPTEVALLCGDATKAKMLLGWQPSVTFYELVKIMVDADVASYSASA